jgi:fumarate hydratase subunit beta
VKKAQVVAYEDLGPEAILKLEVSDMPLVVLIDSHGRDLYGSVLGIDKNA